MTSIADEIKKLAALKSEGLLTDTEFERLKQSLLAGNPEMPTAQSAEAPKVGEAIAKEKKPSVLAEALGWLFGTLFLLAGIPALSESVLCSLGFIGSGLLLLPPIVARIRTKTGEPVSGGVRTVLIFGLMVLAGANIPERPAATSVTPASVTPSASPGGETVATVINLNGFLCAKVTDVRTMQVRDQYEVTCTEYRGGSGTVRYIVNKSTGVAFKAE